MTSRTRAGARGFVQLKDDLTVDEEADLSLHSFAHMTRDSEDASMKLSDASNVDLGDDEDRSEVQSETTKALNK